MKITDLLGGGWIHEIYGSEDLHETKTPAKSREAKKVLRIFEWKIRGHFRSEHAIRVWPCNFFCYRFSYISLKGFNIPNIKVCKVRQFGSRGTLFAMWHLIRVGVGAAVSPYEAMASTWTCLCSEKILHAADICFYRNFFLFCILTPFFIFYIESPNCSFEKISCFLSFSWKKCVKISSITGVWKIKNNISLLWILSFHKCTGVQQNVFFLSLVRRNLKNPIIYLLCSWTW